MRDDPRIITTIKSALQKAIDRADRTEPNRTVTINPMSYDVGSPDSQTHLKLKASFGGASRRRSNTSLRSNKSKKAPFNVALIYQNRPIGEISVVTDGTDEIDHIRNIIEQAASEIAFYVKRHQVQKMIEKNRYSDVQWIGSSTSTMQVDRFVEKASGVDFPVLIEGGNGSGKLITAFSIHCHSSRRSNRFIESCCATWPQHEISNTMRTLWSKAKGGTLYLREIDTLSVEQILRIRHFWRHIVNSEQSKNNGLCGAARLIVCISDSDSASAQLVIKELDYLSVKLPNLNDRKGDIRELAEHYLSKLAHIKDVEFSPDCWQLFEQFNWSGSAREMERLISKLVVMSDSRFLDSNSLLAIIPQLEDQKGNLIELPQSEPIQQEINVDMLASLIAQEKYQDQADFHPALAKSMRYLAENFCNDISLKELSANAFVSPSHLSYLFKHHLDTTFKQILILARTERAKMLLINRKNRKITEIAYDVGFHDLSHFEKTFKRLVGVSPGKYSNQ